MLSKKTVIKSKITIQLQRGPIVCIFIFLFSLSGSGQPGLNQYGLRVIKTIKSYRTAVAANHSQMMKGLKNFLPGIVLDLRYASTNNFMHQKLYPSLTNTYLRLPAADALYRVQKELLTRHLNLKIFDAYRPYSITEKMWEPIHDDRYVADPRKGSNHNRGIAVDLTIIDNNTKQELDMGTGFDNFSDTAHHDFTGLSPAILQNRSLLKNIMEKYGFKSFDTEWWHYALPNVSDFDLLDLSFRQLRKVTGPQSTVHSRQ